MKKRYYSSYGHASCNENGDEEVFFDLEASFWEWVKFACKNRTWANAPTTRETWIRKPRPNARWVNKDTGEWADEELNADLHLIANELTTAFWTKELYK